MPKLSQSQQRAQRNLRIILIIISLAVILSMVITLLPLPQ